MDNVALIFRKIFKEFSSAQDLRETESSEHQKKNEFLFTECWVEDDINVPTKN